MCKMAQEPKRNHNRRNLFFSHEVAIVGPMWVCLVYSPLPNMSTSSSPENAIWGPQKPFREMPGNSGKLSVSSQRVKESQGKGRSRGFREIHSGDPKLAFWGDFPWRMRMAKVDMLGTADCSRKDQFRDMSVCLVVVSATFFKGTCTCDLSEVLRMDKTQRCKPSLENEWLAFLRTEPEPKLYLSAQTEEKYRESPSPGEASTPKTVSARIVSRPS